MAARKRQVPEQSYATRCGLEFGEVAEGWTREGWKVELERKASRCEAVNPGMAAYYRRWVTVLNGVVPRETHVPDIGKLAGAVAKRP